MLGANARRELEENESLPGPAIPIATTPKPAPEPEWKEELSRRLAGYRERQAERQGSLEHDKTQKLDPTSTRPRLPFPNQDAAAGGAPLLPPVRRGAAEDLPPISLPDDDAPKLAEVVERSRPASARVFERYIESKDRQTRRSTRPAVEELLAPVAKRFIAGLLDLCVVALALGVFVAVAHLMNRAIFSGPNGLAMTGGAFAVLLALYWAAYLRLMGSTAGMHWTGLRVLNLDGEPPDVHQRWTRAFGTILSAAAMGVGFLWSLFDEQHFTWHDRLSKTFVALDD